METEHISYPDSDDKNRTTSLFTPELRAPPQPQSRHEARLVERLRSEHGAAFDVYLQQIWNGIEPIDDMEADFENLHWASYARVEHFVDDFIESLGWAEARHQLLRDWAIPNGILVFDRHAFLDHLRSDFDFYEQGGETHVFVK
jgi:hypothetical protein